MKYAIVLVAAVFAMLMFGCTQAPSTGANAGTSYPPGYQAARDGLIVQYVQNMSVNGSINNNGTGRTYLVSSLVATDNGTHIPISLQYCATLNTTNLSNCVTTWSTIMTVYPPTTLYLVDTPIKIGSGSGLQTVLTGTTTGYVNLQYLNVTP